MWVWYNIYEQKKIILLDWRIGYPEVTSLFLCIKKSVVSGATLRTLGTEKVLSITYGSFIVPPPGHGFNTRKKNKG